MSLLMRNKRFRPAPARHLFPYCGRRWSSWKSHFRTLSTKVWCDFAAHLRRVGSFANSGGESSRRGHRKGGSRDYANGRTDKHSSAQRLEKRIIASGLGSSKWRKVYADMDRVSGGQKRQVPVAIGSYRRTILRATVNRRERACVDRSLPPPIWWSPPCFIEKRVIVPPNEPKFRGRRTPPMCFLRRASVSLRLFR